MNNTAVHLLEYDKIKVQLMEYTISEQGKELVNRLQPSTDINTISTWLSETAETRAIIGRNSSIPLHSLAGMDKVMARFGKGTILTPEELEILSGMLKSAGRIKRFMVDKSGIAPCVSTYALSITELDMLVEEIERCIINGRVDSQASTELAKIRKRMAILEDRITSKLESILRSSAYKDFIQDSLVSVKNGAYVIPVKREYRKNIEGNVLDTSASGSTVFIEPAAVKKLREELNLCKIEEEKEEYKILSTLTVFAESFQREISINIETMAHYDFLFAKAKFCRSIDGNTVSINTRNYIRIANGRHPLIGKAAVPLNFTIGDKYRALVITGPNTGGKTVALKTVGLLTMMVQSGLQVPVDQGSEFAVFRDILADIGDGQSIEQSLSTFSSHIRNIISIMECTDPYTLVVIDELGTGTDPAEGMGLAIAIMEHIYIKGSTLIATTHYSEIKDFAYRTEGFENGCMEFDIDSLKPLYRLKIGKPGESNAFLIALRLGMDKSIIEKAHRITYKEEKEYKIAFGTIPDEKVVNNDMVEFHSQQAIKINHIQEAKHRIERQKIEHTFKLGDCVYISSMNRTGIVCELENNKGELGVMVMKKKIKVSKKRLSLYIDGQELYPDEYDFDIVFESKDYRKKKHIMNKKHVDGLVIERTEN